MDFYAKIYQNTCCGLFGFTYHLRFYDDTVRNVVQTPRLRSRKFLELNGSTPAAPHNIIKNKYFMLKKLRNSDCVSLSNRMIDTYSESSSFSLKYICIFDKYSET